MRGKVEDRSVAEPISEIRIGMVRQIIRLEQNLNIKAVVVFGSVANGIARDDSDLDYFLVKEEETDTGIANGEDLRFKEKLAKVIGRVQAIPPLVKKHFLDKEPFFSFDVFVGLYFLSAVGIEKKLGPTILGSRDRQMSFAEGYRIVARTPEDEEEVRNLIQERLNHVLEESAKEKK